ncbi:hypothetical protein [Bacillus salacetis]|nr:hypothetical protein [Bacillus salacetis]
MTVLFGSVEYFENELTAYLANEEVNHVTTNQKLEFIFSTIKEEIAYSFICSETFRKECLENLRKAYSRVSDSKYVVR